MPTATPHIPSRASLKYSTHSLSCLSFLNEPSGTEQAKKRERLKDAFRDPSGVPKVPKKDAGKEPPSGGDQASAATGAVGGAMGGLVGFVMGFAIVAVVKLKRQRPAAAATVRRRMSAVEDAGFSS